MSDQHLAARVRAALDAGEGHPAAGPDLGAALVPDAGRPAQARPPGPLRPGHAPRRHRRALVRLDHRRRQRGGARPTRGSATSSTTATASPSRTPSTLHGAEMIGDDDLGQVQEVAGLQQVLRQPRARSPTTCTRTQEQAAKLGREGKPESYYFPPQLNWTGNNFPYTFFGPRAGDDQGRRPPLPGALERGRQRHPRPLQGVPPQARHRLARPALRAARPRLARDLRAAVGLRRLRHVPVDGRRPARPLGAAGQGRPRGQAPRPRLPRRAARLGEERRSRVQGPQLPRADRPRRRRRPRATSTSGSSTARSTASSSSAPAS